MNDDHIRVLCRFRPHNTRELELIKKTSSQNKEKEADSFQLQFHDNTTVVLSSAGSQNKFTFDAVMPMDTLQPVVFDVVAKATLDDIVNGYNGTIFAYGQTGSGKTFSMMGPEVVNCDEKLVGIIPRSVSYLFNHMRATTGVETSLKVSYLEIYMEKVRDLLSTKSGSDNLKIHEAANVGVWIPGLSVEYVQTEQDVFDLIRLGTENRAVAYTDLNAVSSRSHAVLVLHLEQTHTVTQTTQSGKLNLVDLAGSEKVARTNAKGQTFEEAKKINKSLSALGQCIKALADNVTTSKKVHVPFRDSKLTLLLKDSLCGNTRTTLLLACSPAADSLNETLSSLRFGERAKTIANKTTCNKTLSALELQKLVDKLTTALEMWKQYALSLEKIVEFAKLNPNSPFPELPSKPGETTDSKVESSRENDTFSMASTNLIELTELQQKLEIEREEHRSVIEDYQDKISELSKKLTNSESEFANCLNEQKQLQKLSEEAKLAFEEKENTFTRERDKVLFELSSAEEEKVNLHKTVYELTENIQKLRIEIAQNNNKFDITSTSEFTSVETVSLRKRIEELTNEIEECKMTSNLDLQSIMNTLNECEERNETQNKQNEILCNENESLRSKVFALSLDVNSLKHHEIELEILRSSSDLPGDLNVIIGRLKLESDRVNNATKESFEIANKDFSVRLAELQKREVELIGEKAELENRANRADQIEPLLKEKRELELKLEGKFVNGNYEETNALRVQLRETMEQLQNETKQRLTMEPKIAQLHKQTKRMENIENEFSSLSHIHSFCVIRDKENNDTITQLNQKIAELEQRNNELTQERDRMLLRPSLRSFRTANWYSSMKNAFETKVDIGKLPQKLKQTGSRWLEEARNEASRSALLRGDKDISKQSESPRKRRSSCSIAV